MRIATLLSPRLLEELREYWLRTSFRPKTYLFPGGGRAHATDVPMSAKSAFHAVKHAAQRAGLKSARWLTRPGLTCQWSSSKWHWAFGFCSKACLHPGWRSPTERVAERR